MTNDLIAKARERYLSESPPRFSTVESISGTATMTIPNLDDMGIIGCKLGMEYLAICHDEEAVEEWIHSALAVVKDPELAGILFANVFRGVNVVIGGIIDQTPGLRQQMEKLALEAWTKNFSEGFDA